MTARVDRDPDRVPGAPPGYRPIDLRTARLGSCDRCGAAVNVADPEAVQDHAGKLHQGLRIMWATAKKSPPGPTEQEVPPRAVRSGTGGQTQSKPGDGGTPPPSDATAPPGEAAVPPPGRRPPGGPKQPRPAGPGKPKAGRGEPQAAERWAG